MSSVVALYYRVETAKKPDVTWYLGIVCLTAIIELNIGIICSCMPHIVYFSRHHNDSLNYITSLKALRSKIWRHRTPESEKYSLVNPDSSNPRLKTEILGTVQGEGRFMKTGDFAQTTVSDRTQDSAVKEGVWTRREEFER